MYWETLELALLALEAFSDLEEDVRQSMARIEANRLSRIRIPYAALSTKSRRAGCAR